MKYSRYFFTVISFFSPISRGYAADVTDFQVDSPAGILPEDMELGEALTRLVDILGIVAISIAVISLLIAGILWSLSAGEEEKIDRAKRLISWSLFGLVISLSAWLIVSAVVEAFT